MHGELQSLYHKLLNSHTQLLSEHKSLSTSQSEVRQNCVTQHADFISFIELERNARTSASAAIQDAHQSEMGKLYDNIQSLEILITEDRARTMKQHTETRSCADTKHNELKQCIEERLAMLEERFDVVEPQWTVDFNVLRKEVSSTFATIQTTITEERKSFDLSLSAIQNEFFSIAHGVQATANENEKNILDESAQRKTSFWELQDHIKDISQTVMQLNDMKNEITCEYISHVGEFCESFVQRFEVATMSKQLQSIESKNEKLLREMEAKVEEVRTSLISQGNLHSKCMEEERASFKKSHDEHMRCVEVERDARIRQTAELRAEFVKLITKEREDRTIDASVRRSEVDRTKQFIKAMNIGLGGSTVLNRSTLFELEPSPSPPLSL